MKSLKPIDFVKSPEQQNVKSLYFLEGPDQYFQDMVIARIKNISGITSESEFDRVVLYGNSTTAAEIIEQLEMMPFLNSHRMILLKNADHLPSKDLSQILDYVKEPLSTSIFIVTSQKKENKGNFFNELRKEATVIECKQPYGTQDILLWLNEELLSRNIEMDIEAKNIFAHSIEPDYLLAANELEKLLLYCRDSNHIYSDAVMKVVGKSHTNSIFNLQNAIGDKALKKAITILENLINNRESALFIVTMLARFFATIWKIRTLLDQHTNKSEIMSRHLKDIFPSFRRDYLKFAGNYNRIQIRRIFDLLLEIDTDLKSIDVKEEILIERLILNICRL